MLPHAKLDCLYRTSRPDWIVLIFINLDWRCQNLHFAKHASSCQASSGPCASLWRFWLQKRRSALFAITLMRLSLPFREDYAARFGRTPQGGNGLASHLPECPLSFHAPHAGDHGIRLNRARYRKGPTPKFLPWLYISKKNYIVIFYNFCLYHGSLKVAHLIIIACKSHETTQSRLCRLSRGRCPRGPWAAPAGNCRHPCRPPPLAPRSSPGCRRRQPRPLCIWRKFLPPAPPGFRTGALAMLTRRWPEQAGSIFQSGHEPGQGDW